MKRLLITSLCGILVLVISATLTASQDAKLIDFPQHIQPILTSHCSSCHGATEQKGGFRVDDLSALRDYIEPGDVNASALWTDYLNSTDPDMLMPPASTSHPGGLSKPDLLLMKIWINEGAEGQWKLSDEQASEQKSAIPATPVGKLWAFQGIFHPAAVHLPIALLAVSSIFVFFSFFNPKACEPVAYHCLWIGALGAVGACVTGWSYAVYEGYGAGFSFDLNTSAIDRHRWLGVFIAVFSLITIPIAGSVRRNGDVNKRIVWLLAGIILMSAVSIVGFQGGELTYGEGHYEKYYKQLFPRDSSVDKTPDTASEAPKNEAEKQESSPVKAGTEEAGAEASSKQISPEEPASKESDNTPPVSENSAPVEAGSKESANK
jgi:uncharacterized membrane protein